VSIRNVTRNFAAAVCSVGKLVAGVGRSLKNCLLIFLRSVWNTFAARPTEWLTAIATAILAVFAIAAWRESVRGTEISRLTLYTTQRAYIDVPGVSVVPDTDQPGLVVSPIFENSGNTPTDTLQITSNMCFKLNPLQSDFNFPDFWHRQTPPVTVGARSSESSGPYRVYYPALAAAKAGMLHIYVWGTATYRDVLPKTRKHVTQFCYQLIGVGGDPASIKPGDAIRTTWGQCVEHNCSDDECQIDAEHYAPVFVDPKSVGCRISASEAANLAAAVLPKSVTPPASPIAK
jgi:hypothetical protein